MVNVNVLESEKKNWTREFGVRTPLRTRQKRRMAGGRPYRSHATRVDLESLFPYVAAVTPKALFPYAAVRDALTPAPVFHCFESLFSEATNRILVYTIDAVNRAGRDTRTSARSWIHCLRLESERESARVHLLLGRTSTACCSPSGTSSTHLWVARYALLPATSAGTLSDLDTRARAPK
jgi:hypothetical protein